MPKDQKNWTENWIKIKAGPTISLQMVWRMILEPIKKISPDYINPILEALSNPSSAKIIFEAIGRCESPELTIGNFYELLNKYSIGIEEWLESIEYFILWNEKNKKSPSFSSAINYLSCCADWKEYKPESGTLKEITAEMLEKFGWDEQDTHCLPS